MPLRLLDGLEDFSSWAGSSATAVAGRYQLGIRVAAGGTLSHPLLSTYESDTITVGAAIRFGAIGGDSILTLRSDNGATSHLDLQLNTNGSFSLLRPFSTIATSATGLVLANVWYYLEIQARLHDTTGMATVRLNGATIMTFSGDTKNAGTKTVFDQVRFACGFGGTLAVLLDDVYVMTGAGDSFLGNLTVETLLPNGNGAVNQWTDLDGNSVDNYLKVDESPPSSADFVATGTVGAQDLYTLSNLVHTTGSIVGVCHSAWMMRTDLATPMNVRLLNLAAGGSIYGAEQRIAIAGDPNGDTGDWEWGVRVQFDVDGRITKLRYKRTASSTATLELSIWNAAGTRVAGPFSVTNAGAGAFEYALSSPLVVAAGSVYTCSIGSGGSVPYYSSGSQVVTDSADCTFVGYFYYFTHGGFPGTAAPSSWSFYVEPIFEPEVGAVSANKSAALPLVTTGYRSYDYALTVDPETSAPFTIPAVNTLQTGIELA